MKRALNNLATALRWYESQSDVLYGEIQRLETHRRTIESERDQNHKTLLHEHRTFAIGGGSGEDATNLHRLNQAATHYGHHTALRLGALSSEIGAKQDALSRLRQRIRTLELLQEKHATRQRYEEGRRVESETADLFAHRSLARPKD